ncbi:MAG: hypothetical protein IT438_06205 [Phycisphaerales bacterium]|nr:hypothetical protein [Phycisphaerales bacterium]
MPVPNPRASTAYPRSGPPRLVFGLIAGLAAAGATHAQSPAGPANYSKPAQVRPNQPGNVREELQAEGSPLATLPSLVREGTFVSVARGQMVKGKSGRWFFVFDADERGRTLPPMVVLPSFHLTAMERATEHTQPGTRMLVTGLVTSYRDLNYLLPTAPPLAVRVDSATAAPVAPPPPPTAPAATDAPPAPPSGASEPSIDEIVKRLDKAVSSTPSGGAAIPLRTAMATTPAGPGPSTAEQPPAPPTAPPLSIGSIATRRGRVMRGADGALNFTFDAGSSDLGREAATVMTLQPCLALAAIESLAERAGEGATYTVSGDVTTYRDRNYLLIRSYKANRVTDQVMPTQ